jgi:hypothetical protein
MTNALKTILSLCDYSGAWSAPYREAGYDVRQIDLKNGGDIRLLEYIDAPIYGILAAPPCTEFAVSGARWWAEKGEGALIDALALVDACLRPVALYRPKFWVLENPVGRLNKYLGAPSFVFNPCDYGDAYTKKTCLWGSFVPPLPLFTSQRPVEPVMIEKGGKRGSWMWANLGGKSERTKELRSITPAGFARAFYEANR